MDDAAAPRPPLTAAWLVEVADGVPAGRAALDLVAGACHPAIAHHSARTLRHALDLVDRSGADVDRDALVHACLLHDLGASALAVGHERFEVQGADLAVALLAEHGWALSRREQVWAAIAVHTSPHVAERLTPLTRFVRLGVRADFGDDLVDPALRRATETDHPRLDAERVLSGVVVDAALRDGRRAPATSWAAALLAAHRSSPDPDARLRAF